MILYRGGYKYQLTESATLEIGAAFDGLGFSAEWGTLNNRLLTLRKGYAWDGPSGPTFDSKCGMQGALVHDALYQALREGLIPRTLKAAADQELHDYCIRDGMTRIRAWLWLRAVRGFGLSATIHHKDIRVAP